MSQSVSSRTSEGSISKSNQDCPYCQKTLQRRSIFHHIRINHISEFLESTQKQWIEEAQLGRPLKIMWKDNVDEELGYAEDVIKYGCLSSDKGFDTEERAMRHFKNNPQHLKEHNKQLKQLMKEHKLKEKRDKEEWERNIKKTPPTKVFLQKGISENDPTLAEGFWRGILHWKQACDIVITWGDYYFKDKPDFKVVFRKKESDWPGMKERYRIRVDETRKLLEDKNNNCSELCRYYDYFWGFFIAMLDRFETKPSSIDYKSPDCKFVRRHEDDMDEKYFYIANHKMPYPTVDDFTTDIKPLPSSLLQTDIITVPVEKPMTREEVIKKTMTKTDIQNLSFSIATGKIVAIPQLEHYGKIISNTKQPKLVKSQ